MNHVKEFLVRELGKHFILIFSLLVMSLASVRYLATCSTVDSLVSPENFLNFGTFSPLGHSICEMYSDNGEI